MNKIVCAIEQEIKFTNDLEEGSEQYRKGYIRALIIMAEFLSIEDADTHFGEVSCPAVERLLSSFIAAGKAWFWGVKRTGISAGAGEKASDLMVWTRPG